MSTENTRVSRFGTHAEVVHAVNAIPRSAFEKKKVAVAGQDYRTAEPVTGSFNLGNRIKRR